MLLKPSLKEFEHCLPNVWNELNCLVLFFFFFLGMVLLPVSCTMSRTSVRSSSGTLSDLILWIYLSLTLCVRDLIRSYLNGLVVFPAFFNKSEFGNKEFMIWATISSRSCFCWLYKASPSVDAKTIINLISVLTIWWCPCVESSLVLLEEGICYDQCVLLAKFY